MIDGMFPGILSLIEESRTEYAKPVLVLPDVLCDMARAIYGDAVLVIPVSKTTLPDETFL